MPLATNIATDLAAAREATDLATSIATRMGAASVATVSTILGSNLVEYWDSTAGVGLVSGAVDTWTGQKLGIVASAPAAGQRPAYGADGAYFLGANVVKCTRVATRVLKVADGGATLFASGTRPYVMTVTRNALIEAYDMDVFAVLDSFAAATVVVPKQQYITASGKHGGLFYNNSTAVVSSVSYTTTPTRVSVYMESDNKTSINVDGTIATSASGTGAITAAGKVVEFGYDRGSATTVNFRGAILCAAKPSAAEITALNAWVLANWGV